MPQNYKELFKHYTIIEILSMFQSLLDALDIQPEEALALAGAIHAELRRTSQLQGSSVYGQYARAMALLRYELPETHEYVVVNWQLANLKRTI